jgi:hypothetical protein
MTLPSEPACAHVTPPSVDRSIRTEVANVSRKLQLIRTVLLVSGFALASAAGAGGDDGGGGGGGGGMSVVAHAVVENAEYVVFDPTTRTARTS